MADVIDLGEGMRSLLSKNKFCDVQLKLKSGELFNCHKLVLMYSSEFFETALSKQWSQGEIRPFNCSDFEDEFVTGAFKYCYGFPIVLSPDNVEHYLCVADYFGIGRLMSLGVYFLKSNLTAKTVFKTVKLADKFGLAVLQHFCLDFIDDNFEEAVSAGDFVELTFKLVKLIVARPSLSVHEEFLFSHIASFIDAKGEENIETHKARFAEFSDILSYDAMSLEFFVCECVSRGFLDKDVQNNLLLYHSSLSEPVANISQYKKHRKVNQPSDVYIQRSIEMSEDAAWEFDYLNGDRLEMKSDTRLKLKAVNIFGKPDTSFLYKLSIHNSYTSELLRECHGRTDFQEEQNVRSIRLKNILELQPETWYTVMLQVTEKPTFYSTFCVDSSTVYLNDNQTAKVTFQTARSGSSSATEGQFEGFQFLSN